MCLAIFLAAIQINKGEFIAKMIDELENEEPRSKMIKSKEEVAVYVLDVTKKLIGVGCTILKPFLGKF